MIDQTKLTAETVDVYGEENTRKHYCTIILVPEGRVLNEEDESRIDFHGRSLLFSISRNMTAITTASLRSLQTVSFQG